jgi:hypothetical protein
MENHMKTPHPNPYSTVSISREVYLQLLAVAGQTGFDKEDWEIAADAVNDWVRRNSPDAIAMPATNGYQWKQLFLPNGTLLRTIFNGKNHHCLVEGDQILYEGRAMSPSGFVNAIGGIRRNAWKSLWILLPDTTTWKLADSMRTKKRRVHTRKTSPPTPLQEAHSSAPLHSTETGPLARRNSSAESAHAMPPSGHPAAPHVVTTRGIAPPPPNQAGEMVPSGRVHPSDSGFSPTAPRTGTSSERGKEPGTERRHGDNEVIAGLMRNAVLALSRGLLAIDR